MVGWSSVVVGLLVEESWYLDGDERIEAEPKLWRSWWGGDLGNDSISA